MLEAHAHLMQRMLDLKMGPPNLNYFELHMSQQYF